VVVGGLVVSTLLTLFILPTFYFALESFVAGKAWGVRRRQDR